MFSDCSSLTSIVIGNSVTNISSFMFSGCNKLVSVVIGNAVISIHQKSFSDCTSLTNINYVGTVEQWNTIVKNTSWNKNTGTYTVYCTDGEITKDGTITYYTTSSKGLAFVSNGDGTCYVSGIGTCTDTDIIIPDTYESLLVTRIGDYAFSYCTGLAYIDIPDAVKYIGQSAFAGCNSLTSIVIHDSVISIGGYAFSNCTALTDVYYTGSEKEWANITISSYNEPLTKATRYYYAETAPTTEGNYWHYVDGVPTKW